MPRQSSGRLDCQGRCPGQHALGRVSGQDGRFHTPEYEALPTVQAELVDETLGNNITNGCRTLRSTSALNSNNRKAQIFLPGTYVHYWRREMKETTQGPSRAFFESCAPKPEETTRMKDPQGNFPRFQALQDQEHFVAQPSRTTDDSRYRHS